MQTRHCLIAAAFYCMLVSEAALAYYNPQTGRFLSRDPVGELGFQTLQRAQTGDARAFVRPIGMPAYGTLQRRVANMGSPAYRTFRRERDQTAGTSQDASPYVFVSNDPQNKFDPLGLWWWSKYIEEGNADGSTKITIRKPCVIVILFGHGLSSKPHTFVFEKPCTAGGFVGCDAGSTNTKIPGDNRSDDLMLTDGELHVGAGSSSYPPEEQFQYWFDKAKAGAKTKAASICKKKDCCCTEVYIYGELAGSAWNPDNWAFPGGWSETVKCSEVP